MQQRIRNNPQMFSMIDDIFDAVEKNDSAYRDIVNEDSIGKTVSEKKEERPVEPVVQKEQDEEKRRKATERETQKTAGEAAIRKMFKDADMSKKQINTAMKTVRTNEDLTLTASTLRTQNLMKVLDKKTDAKKTLETALDRADDTKARPATRKVRVKVKDKDPRKKKKVRTVILNMEQAPKKKSPKQLLLEKTGRKPTISKTPYTQDKTPVKQKPLTKEQIEILKRKREGLSK